MNLNSDQRDYVESLATMRPEDKCWCAWYPKGECHSCPPDLSLADRLKVSCPECRNYPRASNPTEPFVHIKGCSRGLPPPPAQEGRP